MKFRCKRVGICVGIANNFILARAFTNDFQWHCAMCWSLVTLCARAPAWVTHSACCSIRSIVRQIRISKSICICVDKMSNLTRVRVRARSMHARFNWYILWLAMHAIVIHSMRMPHRCDVQQNKNTKIYMFASRDTKFNLFRSYINCILCMLLWWALGSTQQRAVQLNLLANFMVAIAMQTNEMFFFFARISYWPSLIEVNDWLKRWAAAI